MIVTGRAINLLVCPRATMIEPTVFGRRRKQQQQLHFRGRGRGDHFGVRFGVH